MDTFRHGWPSTPLTGTASPELLSVLTVDDVDELVAERGLRVPAFRMAQDGALLPVSRYTVASGPGPESPLGQLADPSAIVDQMAGGATLVLQGLQLFHPPAGRLMRSLAADLGARVFVNAFLTPLGAKGFGEHSDPYGAFLVQLTGEKIWRLRASVDDEPTTITLRPRDVLWIPRGWLHDGVAAPDRTSVHLTLAVRPVEATDILTDLTEFMARQVDGELLPPLTAADQNDFRKQVEILLTRLSTSIHEMDVDELIAAAQARIERGSRTVSSRVSVALADDGGR